MLAVMFSTPGQVKKTIASRARARRLSLNLSRESLAERSGVPSSTIKHFETTGAIGLDALLRMAIVLDGLPEFNQLFLPQVPVSLNFKSLPLKRQRGRK
jgi:transcriptional regulator with XRE-family HTH domain